MATSRLSTFFFTLIPNCLLKKKMEWTKWKKKILLQVVPLWRQRAGRDEEKLVIWDYHVILIYKPDERCLVFDLDSDLPFPTYFHKYVTETFRTDAILNPEYHRFFRVVPAPLFLQTFASDRRHMKKPDGSWMKPPPPYPCIMPQRWVPIWNFHLIPNLYFVLWSTHNGISYFEWKFLKTYCFDVGLSLWHDALNELQIRWKIFLHDFLVC